MIWSTLTGLEELMQELDTLGRRSQIADSRGGGGRGQDGRHGRGQWIVVDECGAVSIFAGAVDEATVGRGVFTLQARWVVIDGLLRALGRREAGVGSQSPQKHEEKSYPLVCVGLLRAVCGFLGGGTSVSSSDSSLASTSSAVRSSDSFCGRLPLAHLWSPNCLCLVLPPQVVRSRQ